MSCVLTEATGGLHQSQVPRDHSGSETWQQLLNVHACLAGVVEPHDIRRLQLR